MNNFLVETKQEYTTQLVNILTPLIFEGLQSIYQDALENSSSDDVLKIFQLFLKRIPKWNNDMISRESNRIMNNSKSYSWLSDLIKATLKANISVLTYNPSVKKQIKIDPTFYNNININDFIHKIYIECARDIWNNPYLFYHNFQPIDLKRNQRDAIITIKDCIREAIRKLLPVKHILSIYLGDEIEEASPDDNFDKYISDIESKNLSKLIKKDLEYYIDSNVDNKSTHNECIESCYEQQKLNKDSNKNSNKNSNNESNNESSNESSNESNNETKINKQKSEENTVGSQILNILNNKNLKLTDDQTITTNNQIQYKQKQPSNKQEQPSNKQEPSNKQIQEQQSTNIDNKIKNILKNDLNYDSETSVTNNPNEFHEIFSNSSVSNNNVFNKVNNNNNNKTNFLSNYLQI